MRSMKVNGRGIDCAVDTGRLTMTKGSNFSEHKNLTCVLVFFAAIAKTQLLQ